ncbi:N1221-domain-containing protein [Phialemonium atrogriseum]|uniref:N1221-domain-containing protein n=1 Tax=Phialemonium atrogriseum TaxID=1093897 RepID=A0AAJ0C7T5_9PEZI|nr:N1221-domain-containing protein [Phialemonium atrogriseum]KAK1770302.1 N1221-domain-containing protein [Phialemonium atrogriseum]
MAPIEEEIDEWFVSNFWQWVRLNTAQRNFYAEWADAFEDERPWKDASEEDRRTFVTGLLEGVRSSDTAARSSAIGGLTYLVLGRWTESIDEPSLPSLDDGKIKSAANPSQLAAMKAGVELLADCGGISVIWDATRRAFEPFWTDDTQQLQAGGLQNPQDELLNVMTIMYMVIQEVLSDPYRLPSVQSQLFALEPGLLPFMVDATAKLRWDEANVLPHTQVFLLFWKSILLVFGGSKEIAEAKKATAETDNDDKEKDVITASPLDYHVFRQEITSKYPAYIPPQPVIPLEAEHTSLLPQLPNHPTRNNGANGIMPAPANLQSGGASILHQPVHIATPAPSPPPSPAVGGKGGKKQNYQTNQNFPFMYPPLDASSNSTGGKGGAALQDLLVGRKWEGSDVPASILEAGELFSRRVRMSRASRQLWEEREKFLKFDRGWEAPDDDIIDELDLSSLTLEEKEELGLSRPEPADNNRAEDSDSKVDIGPRSDIDPRIRDRLEAVEAFYSNALPHLQSLVIVLFRAVVTVAANLLVQPANGQQQQQHPGAAGQNNARVNGAGRAQEAPSGANGAPKNEPVSPSDEEIDAVRSKEISAKAVTGIMVLMLKWFKLSHVLKFEYLTQLLLDSNYIPLVLKIFAVHDIQLLVESKTDRIEHSFFYFCNIRAGGTPNPATATTFEEDEESEDDAAPPPIKRRRSPDRPAEEEGEPGSSSGSGIAGIAGDKPDGEPSQSGRPEVDELGYPVNPLPQEPITDFSRRNFFALINHLRVVQKICKNKAHRNLLLVNYKSSNILRKSLKVPQPELRLYTLKLFKNQVPYCGRKWRQSNMRVITAVYLHCRPELRDEWLAGSDVDAEVEEALPLEQALRSLTHWFNLRRYTDKMAPEARAALREEQDFFIRELEKADLTWSDVGDPEGASGSEWEDGSGWG